MTNTPTILLIDDDVDDQEIFNLALENINVKTNCVFANDGVHAMEKFRNDETLIPDFIFLDLNMPRMNGQQCLVEIKKIERLKNVPVYMYSTSADPQSIETHKRLGAEDFIQKPSDIRLLTKVLTNIVKKKVLPVLVCMFFLNMIPAKNFAQQTDTINRANSLKNYTVEQLMNVVVTSVSKTPEKLTEVASAIQVISGEEIKRSGATVLPEALRLATNLQVAQSGSHDWGISARGFNGFPVNSSSLANKLLVLIDGRTVYTPLFGGVYWDVQNVLLEDIEQVEVISGPGGSLWGANAVNGIINIVSKNAKETQGWYASGGAGTFMQDFGALRYGSHVDSTLFFRVYAQRMDYNKTKALDKTLQEDFWYMNQGGFRMDYIPSAKNNFTLQGDVYEGKEDDTSRTHVHGENFIGRWSHTFSTKSDIVLQFYFDRTFRNIERPDFIDELLTYDIDFQHNYHTGQRNLFSWGASYRLADDYISSVSSTYDPTHRAINLWSAFVQDQFQLIPKKLELTIGTKLFKNDYTDVEFHPSVRLAFTPNERNTVWTAVSKSARTPTRFEEDLITDNFSSRESFKSEKVNSFELGYRTRPLSSLSLSVATYFNQYRSLRSLDSNTTGTISYYFGNNLESDGYGVELTAHYIYSSWWTLKGGYTYLYKTFDLKSPSTVAYSPDLVAIDPHHTFQLQSLIDLPWNFQLDAIVRYVDVLPATFRTALIPSYITYDIRVGWEYKWITVSVAGQNLAAPYHIEFGERRIPRSVNAKISLRF